MKLDVPSDLSELVQNSVSEEPEDRAKNAREMVRMFSAASKTPVIDLTRQKQSDILRKENCNNLAHTLYETNGIGLLALVSFIPFIGIIFSSLDIFLCIGNLNSTENIYNNNTLRVTKNCLIICII